MPPPTTILGIAGAALGLADWELWSNLSPLQGVKVSVWVDEEPGLARDMWTLLKIKEGSMTRSPYFRELLFRAKYTLLYGGEERTLQDLQRAFEQPAFPLCLGREDELVNLLQVAYSEASVGGKVLGGTVVRGALSELGARPLLKPGVRLSPPVAERLPLRFEVKGGVRHPRDYEVFTFLPLSLEMEVSGVETLECEGRNFMWLNS